MPTGIVIISESLLESRIKGKILPFPDSTWIHPNPIYENKIIFSPCNNKVNDGSNNLNLGDSIAYGKPAVISCAWFGECYNYCYARRVNARFKASLRIHGHNYKIIYGKDISTIYNAIYSGFGLACEKYKSDYKVIRLNDSGDFISVNEILAWIKFAATQDDLIIYGYTKSSPLIWKVLNQVKAFPDNFRITLSITDNIESLKYTQLCLGYYPDQVITCRIIDTIPDYYPNLPWNNTEQRAIIHDQDFKIALHDNSKIGEYYRKLSGKIGINTC